MLNMSLRQMRNHSLPLGVILTDINGLKELNSRYGNSYGDQVVKSVAAALKDKFGAESVYRYGGGMFLVLLPDISKESFSQRLSDLRESFNSITNYDVSVGNAWVTQRNVIL